ncbi:DUF3108 domain-containing protein [Azospirillum brasilense]|uniref:DUF3108 domain-containing protein n=1 Tax=Azospirillum brasilense TaxID=192 RepID=UPI00190E506B|nr:DUF3108 domain-containing protein [Azospirillum brasilense]MBK3731614.1 DUF3108 domain-containing protein [Azospirillum brasilense]
MKRILLAAGLLTLLPAAGSAATLELDFAAYGGGVSLARGSVVLTEEAEGAASRYRAALEAEAVPWLGLFTNFRYHAESAGRLEAGTAQPDRFRGERRLRRKQDIMTLTFGSDGVDVEAEPPLSPDKAARVPPDSRRGSIDPLSAGAAVILTASRAGGCGGRYPVYDGRRRYDIIMTPQGQGNLPSSRYRIATGSAEVCAVTVRPVAGFEGDRDRDRFFAEGVERKATVWFARAPESGRVVPVTVEVPTDTMTVLVHTVGVKAGL